MNTVGSSPTFKNLKSKKIQSPIQLKEKMRKDYKSNVQTCRDMLINRFRGSSSGRDLRTTLTDIYNNTLNNFNNDGFLIDLPGIEETEILNEIKEELIQNELDWWIEEYERSQCDNLDWSSIQNDDSVICLICQKNNFTLANNSLSCRFCNLSIKTEMCLPDIKRNINESLERHSNKCNHDLQFMTVLDLGNAHIYYLCENCMDMQLII